MRKRISEETKAFRLAAPKIFLFYLMFCVPAYFIAVLGIEGCVYRQVDWVGFHFGLLCEIIVCFFFAWLLFFAFPIGISSKGLHAHSVWGFKRFIAWKDIKSVRTFRLLNLLWLRIYSKSNSRVTYLSLFLQDPKEVLKEMKKNTSARNPVVVFFNKSVF